MNVKILVCCHKKDIMAKNKPYFPIHVGKELSQDELNITGDNTGDNISKKNYCYCELTGMYWAWKNLKEVDYIGLCHYRRYFDFHNLCNPIFPHTTFKPNTFSSINLTISETLIENIKNEKVIMAKPLIYPTSLAYSYCYHHISDDFRILNTIIKETQTEDFKKAFYKVFYQNNKLSPYNMFIMSRKNFEMYCSWLFPIIDELERRIDISNYNSVQRRIFGYISERLLNVFVEAHKLKKIYKPIIYFNNDVKSITSLSFCKYYIRTIVWNFSTHLTRFPNKYEEWIKEL